MRFFFSYEPSGWFHFQINFGKWILSASSEDWLPDSVVLTRQTTPTIEDVFGFWFEDMEFDRYRVDEATVNR